MQRLVTMLPDDFKERASIKLTNISAFIVIWALSWSIFAKEALPPNGKFFALLVLYATAVVAGDIVELLRLPALLGMLLAGFTLRNVFNLTIDVKISAFLRSFALAVILLRAGLGLDADALK